MLKGIYLGIMENKFKNGDIIELSCMDSSIIYREIIYCNKNYYIWRYPDLLESNKSENIFDSRNSNDPKLEGGWKLSDKKFR